ncbi:MAG: hypothetical protein ACRCZI_02635 [Cetobacterium sp.]
MSGKSSIVGSGSHMPVSAYLAKMEQTCIFEDPNLLRNYMRSTLKDVRPDKPLFESDEIRRNNFSEDRLNLRHHGKRVAATPDLPDGTFLDFDGLSRDPRGTALEPDMREHRKQQEARGKFIKYYSDADNSVPSRGISEREMIMLKRKPFYEVKDRLKIFDESMNSMVSGSGMTHEKRKNTAECMQVTDDRRPEMQDEMCYNRTNITNDLSNNTSIGWRRTTDHRFKVAQYGMIRKAGDPNKSNALKNRSNTFIEHDFHLAWKDQNTSKSFSLNMIDLAKQRARDMRSSEGTIFSKSEKTQMRKKRLRAKDIILKRQSGASQADAPNVTINGDRRQHVTGRMTKYRTDHNRMEKIIIDPFIIHHMSIDNRNMSKKKLNDLREQITRSSTFNGLLQQQNNRSMDPTNKRRNILLWQGVASYQKGMSMKVANYRRTGKNSRISGPKNNNAFDYEDYKQEQKIWGQRGGNMQNPDLYVMEATDYDQDFVSPEITGTKLVGGLGNKYMREYMDNGDMGHGDEITASIKR